MNNSIDEDLVAKYARAINHNLETDIRRRVERDRERRELAERLAKRRARENAPPKVDPGYERGPTTIERGSRGEDRATNALVTKGLSIVQRNYRCRIGELDVVAFDDRTRTIIFVEVRTRRDGEHGHAAEMVDVKKQRKVAQVAAFFLGTAGAMRPDYDRVRFDVIAITGDTLDHIEDAWRLRK